MINWKDIQEGFDKYYQQEWKKLGLTYQDAQEWIQAGFELADYYKVKQWKNLNFAPPEAKSWIENGLTEWRDYETAAYLRWKDYQPGPDLNLEQLREKFNVWRKSSSAQEWLDCFYPKEQRKEIIKLNINERYLIGALNLSDFENLEELICHGNQLTSLDLDKCLKLKYLECERDQLACLNLTNCSQLKTLNCSDNYLTDLKPPFPAEQLTVLDVSNNNFPEQGLSMFSHLVNLEELRIGNYGQEKINQSIYNRFKGSLEPLQKLTKLKSLHIGNTDIDSGLEYLPESVKDFRCLARERKDAKVKKLSRELYPKPIFGNKKVVTLQEWKKANPKLVEKAKNKQIKESTKQQKTQIKTDSIINTQGQVLVGNTFGDHIDLSISITNNYQQEKELLEQIDKLKQQIILKENSVNKNEEEITRLKQQLIQKERELNKLRLKNADLLSKLLVIKEKELEELILAIGEEKAKEEKIKLARRVAEKQKEIDELKGQLKGNCINKPTENKATQTEENKQIKGVKVMSDEFIQNKQKQAELQAQIIQPTYGIPSSSKN